ncbi:MAG: 16S rRNA (cytosine(967)-C(5))-methyltransferase RsmB [Solirubrobacteraceae bacterium]
MSVRVGASPARRCAFAVIRRVFEQGAYTDRALISEAAGLDARERALATALAYGTVQRRATLDHLVGRLCSRPVGELDPPVLAALRLGLFQLLFLGGVADHAAVNESVELIKGTGRGGAAMVNAVLRRATREGQEMLAQLDDGTAAGAAVRHSVPVWLAEKWWTELGEVQARALMSAVNQPAEAAIRINELLSSADEVRARLPVPARGAAALPEALVLQEAFDVHGSELFAAGAVTPQSRASMLVARVLAPAAGSRVLDLCAAPGGKTTHLAALMGDEGTVVAVERHPGRAEALRRTCARMHAGCVVVDVADASRPLPDPGYDYVLVDPPCSGLGTLQSRPDRRWRASPEAILELARLQTGMLGVAGDATARGGALVYSVCTISREESEDVVEAFLGSHPEFQLEDLQAEYPQWRHPAAGSCLQLTPHRDGTDGFFIAKFRRV